MAAQQALAHEVYAFVLLSLSRFYTECASLLHVLQGQPSQPVERGQLLASKSTGNGVSDACCATGYYLCL